MSDRCKDIEASIRKKFKKTIWRQFTKAINEYELIQDGDVIACCISGGKDSMLLAKLFQELQRHGRNNFQVKFLVMNPGYNDANYQQIIKNAEILEVPITVFESEIFEAVSDIEDSPCYLCARMRRGYLYAKAQELGCNKIALGHHFDDVIETILMGMLYGGQVQTMMPKLHSTNFPGMELIRPMYLIREADVIHWAQYNDLQFIRCACRFTEMIEGEQDKEQTSKRKEIKKLIADLHEINPYIEKNIFRSVENVNLKTIIAYKEDGVKHSFLEHYEDWVNPWHVAEDKLGADIASEDEELVTKQVRDDLMSLQDLKYKDFHSKLMPNVNPDLVIGVRTPELRKYAKQFWKHNGQVRTYIDSLPHKYYEENNLHGFLLEQIKDYDECIAYIDKFLPYVDNWATCDSFNPKVLGKCKDRLAKDCDRWISSGKTYHIRFAIVCMLRHMLEDDVFDTYYLDKVAAVSSDEYYVQMAQAWFFATALTKQYPATLPYITEYRLGEWVHNKSIQKAVESLCIDKETKEYLKSFKIKKK